MANKYIIAKNKNNEESLHSETNGGKTFRIIKSKPFFIDTEIVVPKYPYIVEQYHTILFFIHYWKIPKFRYFFNDVDDAEKFVKNLYPDAIIL